METPNLMPDAPAGGHAPAHKKGGNWLAMVLIIVLVLAGLGAGYWAFTTYGPGFGGDVDEQEEVISEREMHVAWQPAELVGNLGYIPVPESMAAPEIGADCVDPAARCNLAYYKIGMFIDGPYVDSELYMAFGLGELGGPPTFRFVKTQTGAVLLAQHSDLVWVPPGEEPAFTEDKEYRIPEISFPTFIEVPGEDMVLQRTPSSIFERDRFWSSFRPSELVAVFETELGTIWTDTVNVAPTPTPGPGAEYYFKGYGFYLRGPDDMVAVYEPLYGFIAGTRLNITWDETGGGLGEYVSFEVGGCGRSGQVAVMPPHVVSRQELRQAGITSGGEPVLEFANTSHHMLTTLYEFAPSYFKDGQDPYSRFLRRHPLFFWEDPFGRLVKFQANDILPAAECAKPVIYLYPQESTWVDVELNPQGGFLVSEPEYNGGWYVKAEPDGTLYHPATENEYPYLFWEGRGGVYRTPDKGWSVSRGDVSSFLSEKLGLLGLNARETADFKEFWLPRMQNSPWYFVTFMGNSIMERIAPMSVSPQPDTVIRVLMDFIELDEPIEVEEPVIRTPERKGFTVIEWGGVRR